MQTVVYLFWSCSDADEAQRIALTLLDEKLIACASILPEVKSIYRWKEKIEHTQEVKLILKTQRKHFSAIESRIKVLCSYQVPEIVQIEITQGNSAYIDWVIESTSLN